MGGSSVALNRFGQDSPSIGPTITQRLSSRSPTLSAFSALSFALQKRLRTLSRFADGEVTISCCSAAREVVGQKSIAPRLQQFKITAEHGSRGCDRACRHAIAVTQRYGNPDGLIRQEDFRGARNRWAYFNPGERTNLQLQAPGQPRASLSIGPGANRRGVWGSAGRQDVRAPVGRATRHRRAHRQRIVPASEPS